MTDVILAGIGQIPVGEHWNHSLKELAFQAVELALADSGGLRPEALFVANQLSPSVSRQAHLGALVADFAGMWGIEASAVEAGGASGGAALRAGYQAVAAGSVEAALVVGVEKSTEQAAGEVEAALASTLDSDYEAALGLTSTAQAALLMNRYLHEFDVPRQAFAGFAITAHANAVHNPHAMFRSPLKPETYASAGLISDPLNMFDAAPTADGAAAVLLVRGDLLPGSFQHPPVRVSGSSSSTAALALHDRPEPLDFGAARLSVERACRQAGCLPGDIDLFELHDAYSIYAALSLEAAGFAERGQGWRLAESGEIGLNGRIPIATFGGLKARGYPGGASGVYQVVEAVLQLRGQAGENQVPGAQRALVQSLGGAASTAVTHVLDRLDG